MFNTRATRHLRQRFQATGRKEDRPRSGRPRVATLGQDRYIRNTHLRNRFQTSTANTANTLGTQTAQTVHLPNCAQSLARGWTICTSSICWLCFSATSLRNTF